MSWTAHGQLSVLSLLLLQVIGDCYPLQTIYVHALQITAILSKWNYQLHTVFESYDHYIVITFVFQLLQPCYMSVFNLHFSETRLWYLTYKPATYYWQWIGYNCVCQDTFIALSWYILFVIPLQDCIWLGVAISLIVKITCLSGTTTPKSN